MINGFVYLVTSPSGRQYVGITGRSVHARWRQHVNAALNGKKSRLSGAIRKYGENAFNIRILARAPDIKTLHHAERLWIAFLDTQHSGYNVTSSGDGAAGVKRTPAQLKRLSEIKKGKKASDEARRKMSESHKRVWSDPERLARRTHNQRVSEKTKIARLENAKKQVGRKATQEHKEKISKKAKIAWSNPEIRERRTNAVKKAFASSEIRIAISERAKARWAKPGQKEKVSASIKAALAKRKEKLKLESEAQK